MLHVGDRQARADHVGDIVGPEPAGIDQCFAAPVVLADPQTPFAVAAFDRLDPATPFDAPTILPRPGGQSHGHRVRVDITFLGIPGAAYQSVGIDQRMFAANFFRGDQLVFETERAKLAREKTEFTHALVTLRKKESADHVAADFLTDLFGEAVVEP